MKTFSRIFKFLKQHRLKLFLGFICLVIVDALQLIIPKVIQWTIDGINRLGSMDLVVRNAFYIVLITLGIGLARFGWRIFIIGTGFEISAHLRALLYGHLQKLTPNYYNHNKTGDLMAHATNDINAVRMIFGIGWIAAFDGIVLSAASIVFMLNINVRLTVIALIPLFLLAFITRYFGSKLHKYFKIVQATFAKITDRTQEIYSGIKIIKTFVQEEKEKENFTKLSEEYIHNNMTLVKYWGAFFPLMTMIVGISTALVVVYGGSNAILGEITVGEFVAFISYLGILAWPMMAIGWVMNIYQRGRASMERINVILDTQPDIQDSEDAQDKEFFQGFIEFKNTGFIYENDIKVLEDISFSYEPGKTFAIVGRTGSGKSTIINLLLRMWDCQEGEILIDKKNIKDWKLSFIRNNIAVVPQTPFLFSASIADNIAFSNLEASREEVEEAAKLACIHDDILEFPDGYDTIVGERGVTLSGGQKQRVSIARAILKKASVIVLDDSLSAVDTKTEDLILSNVKNRMPNTGFIIIAHRISSIQHADHIIVLDEGKIIEEGKHESLLKNGLVYSQIYKRQQLEEELEKA